ncbi:MAG: AAA family ATPase, partial [Streptosporangiaceae bacterium]
MILVEREGEFATLHALFADSLRARSRVAIISGGVATGKTSLLRALGEKAADSGAVFLSAVASPLEGQVPLGVVEQLFRSPGAPTAGTERFTRWLEAQVLPGPGTAVDLRGLWEILRDLAEHQPVVVGIDDIHHADEASLQCLLYLLRRLRSARLLTVLTECPRSRAANAPLQGEFLREPQSRQIRLEPLSRAGVTTLLARHLDSATARYLAPHFHQASAGHPMLVHTLIEDYLSGSRLAEPEAGSEPVAGEAFSRAVLSFLHRHQAPVMEVARAIAIMDSPTPLPLLGSLLDLDSVSTAQAVSTLAAAGILADGTFRHGAIQAAVVDGIPPDLRRSLHDRVAELLHAEGGSASEVAAHLVASDHHKSPWAISIIQEAAEQALADDDLTTGIHYLMTAQRHCGDRRQRSAIASALADAEWRVDPSRALRHLPDVLDEELLVDHASLPVTSLLWHGRVPEALGLLDTLERRPDAAPGLDTPRVWLSYLYPEHFRLGTTAGDLDDDEVTALVSELLNGDQTTSLTFAESILERFRLNHKTLAPLSIALAALIDNDRLDSAATWCDALVEESVARRSPTWRALFTALRAMVHFRQGNLAAAEQRAEAALNLISPKGWGVMVGLPLACLILTRTAMGRFQQAADLLDIDVPEAMFRTPMGLHYLYARGRHHLAVGRFHAALHDFRACGQLTDQWGV